MFTFTRHGQQTTDPETLRAFVYKARRTRQSSAGRRQQQPETAAAARESFLCGERSFIIIVCERFQNQVPVRLLHDEEESWKLISSLSIEGWMVVVYNIEDVHAFSVTFL